MPRRKKPRGSVDPDREISAQVVLPPASGRRRSSSAPATVDTLREFVPSPDVARRAQEALKARGFRVGPMVGNSFAITAAAGVFERALGVGLAVNPDGGIQCVTGKGSASYECPRGRLPREIAPLVETITFTPPPDFGPTRFTS